MQDLHRHCSDDTCQEAADHGFFALMGVLAAATMAAVWLLLPGVEPFVSPTALLAALVVGYGALVAHNVINYRKAR